MLLKSNLRFKTLIYFVLPVSLFFIITVIILFSVFQVISRDLVIQRDKELSRVSAVRLTEGLSPFLKSVIQVSAFEEINFMDKDELNLILTKNNYITNFFDIGFILYDKNGNIVFTTNEETAQAFNDSNLELKSYFEKIEQTFRPLFTNLIKNDNDLIAVIVPVIKGNEIEGYIAGFISLIHSSLDQVYTKVLETKAGKTGFCYLIDGNGFVLSHRYKSYIGKVLPNNKLLEIILKSDGDAVFIQDEAGKDIVCGFAPVPNSGWYVITQERWEVIQEPIQKFARNTLFFLIIGCIIFGLILFFSFGKTIINPILNLANTSQYIAEKKDYSVRINTNSRDEIGFLYKGFNTMLDEIESDKNKLFNTSLFLNNVINSMSSILIATNDLGIITHFNDKATQILGINSNEAINKKITEIIPKFSQYNNYFNEILLNNTSKELLRQTLRMDENKIFNIYMFPLSYKSTKGVVIRIDDITKIEEKENQLRQAQKMESIGILAGGLAHDFNNVLGGIFAILSIIKYKLKKYNEINKEELSDYLETLEEAGKRARDMIQQVLSLSRKQELNFRKIDLNQSLKNTIKLCSNSFDKAVELKVKYNINPAITNADSSQIEQVLLNFFVNASHAMTIMRSKDEKQGGTLNSEISRFQVDKLFCESHPDAVEGVDYWRVSISDTGIGMDSKTAAKMFDPFFSTKQKDKGSGLGLAMAYNIVQQHKGFIDFYSEIGLGTTFNLYLPVLDNKNMVDDQVIDDSVPEGNGLILVVDDEKIMRESAKKILTLCGYDTIAADDGKAGLEIFGKKYKEIKLVILDMVMPKLSGKETYLELKKIYPGVKVLLSSGFKQDERVTTALELGIHGFIQKPYTLRELAIAVDNILREKV